MTFFLALDLPVEKCWFRCLTWDSIICHSEPNQSPSPHSDRNATKIILNLHKNNSDMRLYYPKKLFIGWKYHHSSCKEKKYSDWTVLDCFSFSSFSKICSGSKLSTHCYSIIELDWSCSTEKNLFRLVSPRASGWRERGEFYLCCI